MAVAPASRSLLVALLLTASSASALDRYDHRGSIGLLVSGDLEGKDSIPFGGVHDVGTRYVLEVGGTYAVGFNGNEILLLGSGAFAVNGKPTDWSIAGGYRGYFGQERLKTYFDLDLALHFTPAVTIGPRFGIGVQYEVSSVFGAFGGVAGEIGIGQAVRFSAQVVIGIQLRNYVLE